MSVIKTDLNYTEKETYAEVSVESGNVIFHPKRWEAKASG